MVKAKTKAKPQVTIQLAEILDAMEESLGDCTYWLDLQTGKVETLFNEEFEDLESDPDFVKALEKKPDRFREIPTSDSHEDYALMASFADAQEDDEIRDLLGVALQGKGAFGRFRSVISRDADVEQAWYRTQREAAENRAREWLSALPIEATIIEPPPPSPPQVTTPQAAKRPSIDLLDVLVLGGNAERIGDLVRRELTEQTADSARGVFKQLARDLCRYYEMPWRNSHVQGTNHFAIERVRLAVEGSVVSVEVTIDAKTWSRFR